MECQPREQQKKGAKERRGQQVGDTERLGGAQGESERERSQAAAPWYGGGRGAFPIPTWCPTRSLSPSDPAAPPIDPTCDRVQEHEGTPSGWRDREVGQKWEGGRTFRGGSIARAFFSIAFLSFLSAIQAVESHIWGIRESGGCCWRGGWQVGRQRGRDRCSRRAASDQVHGSGKEEDEEQQGVQGWGREEQSAGMRRKKVFRIPPETDGR